MCFPIHEDSYRTVENLIDGTCILVISVEVHISVCLYMYMYMCLKTMTEQKLLKNICNLKRIGGYSIVHEVMPET